MGLIIVVQAAGSAGALVTDPAYYRELVQPSWAPPGWLFGPVWLTLYTMIAVSIWLCWRAPRDRARTTALRWQAAHMVLNAAWTPIFFGLKAPGWALLVIVALALTITGAIVASARVTRTAAWLLAPYLAWVAFATALNAALVYLNR